MERVKAMKRLAKWLYKKAWWDDEENLYEMRRDFMTAVVSSVMATQDKVDLLTILLYGPEEADKNEPEETDKNEPKEEEKDEQ